MRSPVRLTSTLMFLALALAGCSAPAGQVSAPTPVSPTADDPVSREGVEGQPGSVGGSVRNSAPFFVSSSQSATTGENRGSFAVVFSAQVKDPNTAKQLKNVSISATGPSVIQSNREISVPETMVETPPAFGSDGWRLWSGGVASGILHLEYRFVFPALSPPGKYVFTMRAEDRTGASNVSNPHEVTITAYSDILIDPVPVSADGDARPRENWGQWVAEAGGTSVLSTNYVKLVNTGQVPNARVVIDFAPQFTGADDANFTIPVADNVRFAWWEDTTPNATAPNEGTYNFASPNADGTVTVGFTGKGNVIYVTYQIVTLPEILPIQSYGISFTVTEL